MLGGIAFQFFIGFSVSYFVYTIGTLIIEPEKLNVTAAIIGLAFILSVAVIIAILISKSNKDIKKEFTLY